MYERSYAAQDEQIAKDIDNVAWVELFVDLDRQALPAVPIYDVERAERFSIFGAVMDKVFRPDLIAALWPKPDT